MSTTSHKQHPHHSTQTHPPVPESSSDCVLFVHVCEVEKGVVVCGSSHSNERATVADDTRLTKLYRGAYVRSEIGWSGCCCCMSVDECLCAGSREDAPKYPAAVAEGTYVSD